MIGLVFREERVEILVGQAVGMLAGGLELHQVHDVDHADLQLRQALAEDGDGREDFEGRDVAGSRHDDVRLSPLIVAGPFPDADAGGAVLDGFVHVQPLRGGMLAGDHDVDVMAAAEAVVHDAQETVRVRRQIDAHHLRFLVHDQVDEAGILVGEAVVILPPDVAGEEVVERGDLPAPGQVESDLKPLGVLVEHGIDDVGEGFVAVEQAMAAGQEIAFKPAFTLVLAEDLHDPALGGEEFVALNCLGVPLALRGFEDSREAVGNGFVGAEDAEVLLVFVEADDVAEESAEGAGVLGIDSAWFGDFDGVVAEVGDAEVAKEQTAVGVRVGAHATIALWRELGQFRLKGAVLIEQLLGADSS